MPAAEIFIQATETDPDVIARGVVREAHERLRTGLAVLAADLRACLAGAAVEAPTVIDVRQFARGGRHPRVFARYARLAPGEAFILVNSHDPKPLRREFDAIHSGAFSWDYLQTGPEERRVRIGRVAVDA